MYETGWRAYLSIRVRATCGLKRPRYTRIAFLAFQSRIRAVGGNWYLVDGGRYLAVVVVGRR